MVTSAQSLPLQSKHSLSKLFNMENNLDCFGFTLCDYFKVQFSGQCYLELRNVVSPQCARMNSDL